MMITRVTSGVTNVNRLFTKVNKNWKIQKFDYIFRRECLKILSHRTVQEALIKDLKVKYSKI